MQIAADMGSPISERLRQMPKEFTRGELELERAYLTLYPHAKIAGLYRRKSEADFTDAEREEIDAYTHMKMPSILGVELPSDSSVVVYDPFIHQSEDLLSYLLSIGICWKNDPRKQDIAANLHRDSQLGGSFALLNYQGTPRSFTPSVYTRDLVVLHKGNPILFYDTIEGYREEYWEIMSDWEDHEKSHDLLLSILATFSLARKLGIVQVAFGESEGIEFSKHFELHGSNLFAYEAEGGLKMGLKPSGDGYDGVRVYQYRRNAHHGRFPIMDVIELREGDVVGTIQQTSEDIAQASSLTSRSRGTASLHPSRRNARLKTSVDIFRTHATLYRKMAQNGFDDGFLGELGYLEDRLELNTFHFLNS